MIVDAHMHAWDSGRFRMAWAEGSTGFAARPFADYQAACAGTGIGSPMIVEVDVSSAQRWEEATDLSARHQRGEVSGVVACVDPRDADACDQTRAIARLPGIKGIRWIARRAENAADLAGSTRARAAFSLFGELDLVFDLNMPADSLDHAAAIAAAAPGTRFVLDHCGSADPAAFGCDQGRPASHDAEHWRRGIAKVAENANVACKISGIVTPLKPGTWKPRDLEPIISHCFQVFGPGRVMFGSDWPVCTMGGTLPEWLAAARACVSRLTEGERADFFSNNVQAWYGVTQR